MEKVMLSKLRKGSWFIDYSGEVYRKGEYLPHRGFYAVYGLSPDAISCGSLSSDTMVLPFPKTKANKALIKSLFDEKK